MSNKKQTAVEWLVNVWAVQGTLYNSDIEQAKEREKDQMVLLVESLKDYTHESHVILGHDEREASEFVEIYLNPFREDKSAWEQGVASDELFYYNDL